MKMRRTLLFPTVLATLLLFALSAAANDITFYFTGSITSTTGTAPFARGDTFSGSYTFDSTATDSNAATDVGDYFFTTSPYGITVAIDGYTITTSPGGSPGNFLIEVLNNHSGEDGYTFHSYSNDVSGSPTFTVTDVGFSGNDPTQTLFSSDALPLVPPDLSSFSTQVFGISGGAATGPDGPDGGGGWDATGTLDSLTMTPVTSVPEPSGFVLLGGGLAAMLLMRPKSAASA
jgi:hypothetical protein